MLPALPPMARLVANNAETTISHLALQRGINTVGRAEGNHHVIPHASVSSRHCEIVVDHGAVSVRDLGSTNGTFIDDQQVQQGALAHGQRLKCGSVEFVLDAPELVASQAGALRVSVPRSSAVPPPMEAHGHTAAEAIAAITPVLRDEPSFYRQVPRAFAYPFLRNGLILMIIGTIVFTGLDLLTRVRVGLFALVFAFIVKVITSGYFCAYMQKIIMHTAQGEDEMPDFPEFSDWWSDIILPFLLVVGTISVSFLPVIVVAYLMKDSEVAGAAILAASGFSAFYLPMALLAVAMTDNIVGVSPHVVVPSIIRVFLPYVVTFALLAMLMTFWFFGRATANRIPLALLGWKILVTVAMGFVSLYLFTVIMRILGLLFRSYRSRLGWL